MIANKQKERKSSKKLLPAEAGLTHGRHSMDSTVSMDNCTYSSDSSTHAKSLLYPSMGPNTDWIEYIIRLLLCSLNRSSSYDED